VAKLNYLLTSNSPVWTYCRGLGQPSESIGHVKCWKPLIRVQFIQLVFETLGYVDADTISSSNLFQMFTVSEKKWRLCLASAIYEKTLAIFA